MNVPAQHTSVAEAETALVHLLLTAPGKRRAYQAFMLDGRLYRLTLERIIDEPTATTVLHSAVGLPLEPIDLRTALQRALADDNLGPDLAEGMARLIDTGGNSNAAAIAVADGLWTALRWDKERSEA